MATRNSRIGKSRPSNPSKKDLEQVVEKAKQEKKRRLEGYREQSLRIHPWVCARCGRHFNHKNLHLLTVHHKDHDHNNNPPDGSNWENLCVYCHDNEHGRYDDIPEDDVHAEKKTDSITHNPFAALSDMIKNKG